MPDGLVQGHALLVRTPGPSSFLRKHRPLPVDSDAQNFSLLNPKSSPLQASGISLCQPSSHPRRPGSFLWVTVHSPFLIPWHPTKVWKVITRTHPTRWDPVARSLPPVVEKLWLPTQCPQHV